MAELPSVIDKILSEETDTEQPVSSALAQKFGSDINALIDALTFAEFTSGGTYNIPLQTTHLLVAACGGGGGGAGSDRSLVTAGEFAGFGGEGVELSLQLLPVVGGETATVAIGAGGAGGGASTNGSDGGNTTLATPSNGTATWFGGRGGDVLRRMANNASFSTDYTKNFDLSKFVTKNSYSTAGGGVFWRNPNDWPAIPGQNSIYPAGTNGVRVGDAGGGGGGGGGSFGPGGNGSDGSFGVPSPGGSAAATSYGSGGGASGVGAGLNIGGSGAGGYLAILRALNI